MTTAQLDMLTESVHDTLLNYINMISNIPSNDRENKSKKVELLYGLIEYMLTDEIVHGIIMRSKFIKFNSILLKNFKDYRKDSLVLNHEYMMNAMDELEGLIYNNCALKCLCKHQYCLYKENTRPKSKVMLKRPQFVKDKSIAILKKVAADGAYGAYGCLRRSERLINKRKRDE